ncbi:MAG: sarcosine oxidase subunit gamma family protein [Rhodospirillales bacterium]
MSDTASPRLSPFAGHLPPGRTGRPDGQPRLTVIPRPELQIVQVAGRPEQTTGLAKAIAAGLRVTPPIDPNMANRETGLAAIWTGPCRWLFVADHDGPSGLNNQLSDLLADNPAAVTDLSHARAVLNISGTHVRDVLAKGCGLDFHPARFTTDHCAQTSIAHTAVLIECRGTDQFDLYISRSYAVFLSDWLINAGREYGVDVSEN